MLFLKSLIAAFPLPCRSNRVWNYLPAVNNERTEQNIENNYTYRLENSAGPWSLIQNNK